MSDDTYEVSVSVDQNVVDRNVRLEVLGHGELEKLFDDIAAILEYYKRERRANINDVRGDLEFSHPTDIDGVTDLMDTGLIDVMVKLGYLAEMENGYRYNLPQ